VSGRTFLVASKSKETLPEECLLFQRGHAESGTKRKILAGSIDEKAA
jgi:hypothetical protein